MDTWWTVLLGILIVAGLFGLEQELEYRGEIFRELLGRLRPFKTLFTLIGLTYGPFRFVNEIMNARMSAAWPFLLLGGALVTVLFFMVGGPSLGEFLFGKATWKAERIKALAAKLEPWRRKLGIAAFSLSGILVILRLAVGVVQETHH